ncbi:MAG: hypothetical protein H6719_32735 [Sandaracinaceae bacterium]|nr:hypothetical protein [Sandaracinaceae bacterium]
MSADDGLTDLNDHRRAGVPFDGRGMPVDTREGQSPPEPATRASDSEPRAETIETVLETWREEGKVERLSTGLPQLDAATRGGPALGERVIIQGAPDAGKTALLIQLLHHFGELGFAIGVLCIDEEPGDIVGRLAQRQGIDRDACESREPHTLEIIRTELCELELLLFDADFTIEAAAEALARFAAERSLGAVLGIDSIQTARCDAEAGRSDGSMTTAVEMRVTAIRSVCSTHGMLVLATSEMARDAYRSNKPGEPTSALAASKFSGAIEYAARVLISLRNEGEDVIQLEIPKNKLGPRFRDGRHITLKLDRASQTLREIEPQAGATTNTNPEEEAARTAALAEELVEALRDATRRGKAPTTRPEVLKLVRGAQKLKAAALTRLLKEGRLTRGHGKPYRVNAGAEEKS